MLVQRDPHTGITSTSNEEVRYGSNMLAMGSPKCDPAGNADPGIPRGRVGALEMALGKRPIVWPSWRLQVCDKGLLSCRRWKLQPDFQRNRSFGRCVHFRQTEGPTFASYLMAHVSLKLKMLKAQRRDYQREVGETMRNASIAGDIPRCLLGFWINQLGCGPPQNIPT